jgi:hypothetical protein
LQIFSLIALLLVSAMLDIKANEENKTLKAFDGQQLLGRVVDFEVGMFEMSRKFGKVHVDGTEYGKLSREKKYLVDNILKTNNIPNLNAGIKIWGQKPYRFPYPIVRIESDGKVSNMPMHLLSRENIDSLLPKYTAWYQKQQQEIAAKKAELERANIAEQDKRDLARLRAKERQDELNREIERATTMKKSFDARRCTICGSIATSPAPEMDTHNGVAHKCTKCGRDFYTPR